MKINPLGHTQTTDAQSKGCSKTATQNESFSRVLNETINEKAGTVSKAVSADMIPSLPISIDENHQCIESIQQSIDHLEQYKNILADPKASLRSMEPTINSLRKDADQLGRLMDGIASEEQIKSLMNETVELISHEISLFEQGAYVD